jgi:hypothetical protein
MENTPKVKLPEFITKNTQFDFEKYASEGEVISKGLTTGYDGDEFVLLIITDENSKYKDCWYLDPTNDGYSGLVYSNNEWIEFTLKK